MRYLVDTSVWSELRRARPHPGVRDWFAQRPASTPFLSVLTLGDIRKGGQAAGDERRQRVVSGWLATGLPACSTGRVSAVDTAVADRWRRLVAEAGRPLPAGRPGRDRTGCRDPPRLAACRPAGR